MSEAEAVALGKETMDIALATQFGIHLFELEVYKRMTPIYFGPTIWMYPKTGEKFIWNADSKTWESYTE